MHICDAIRVPGREVMAAFPKELLLYVRQYSAYVCMPYGREVVMGVPDEFYEIMEETDSVELERLVPLSRAAGCHFVILSEDREIDGAAADYGWTIFAELDGYIIYRDNEVELVIP